MLPVQYRLRKRKEFSRIYHKGKKTNCNEFTIYFLSNRELKVGFSVSKKIGNAVIRNFYRRKLQSIVYEELSSFKKGSYIIVANNGIINKDFQKIKASLLKYLASN